VGSLFNSLSTRIALAFTGGIFYGLLIYSILSFISFSDWALPVSIPVFVLYFASRLFLLFSGIPTPYYSKGKGTLFKSLPEDHPFRKKAGLIGTFYHYHDIALFVVMVIIGIGFIVSLFIDGFRGQSMGTAFQDLQQILLPALDHRP
jgi:hypothetical protein